jgi:hypothetical protein
MGSYQFNKVQPDYARLMGWGALADMVEAAAAQAGVTVVNASYTDGVITVVTDPDLTGQQETALGQIIADYDFRDWVGESEAAKVTA